MLVRPGKGAQFAPSSYGMQTSAKMPALDCAAPGSSRLHTIQPRERSTSRGTPLAVCNRTWAVGRPDRLRALEQQQQAALHSCLREGGSLQARRRLRLQDNERQASCAMWLDQVHQTS